MSVIAVVHVFLTVTVTAFKYSNYDTVTYDRPLVTSTPSLPHSYNWYSKLQRSKKNEKTEKFTLLSTGQFVEQDPLNLWIDRQSNTRNLRETRTLDNSLGIGNPFERKTRKATYKIDTSAQDIEIKECFDSKKRNSWNGDNDHFDKFRNTIVRRTYIGNKDQSQDKLDHLKKKNLSEGNNGIGNRERQIRGRFIIDDINNDSESYIAISDNSNIQQRQQLIRDIDDKYLNDTDEENHFLNFLDRLKKKMNSEDIEQLTSMSYRQGRKYKLTSQQQGTLLVEALRKKRNYTGDHRGHNNDLQNGIMDMLGRSRFRIIKIEIKGGMIFYVKNNSSFKRINQPKKSLFFSKINKKKIKNSVKNIVRK